MYPVFFNIYGVKLNDIHFSATLGWMAMGHWGDGGIHLQKKIVRQGEKRKCFKAVTIKRII